MSCNSCRPGLAGLIRSKLGRCPACMRASFLGASLSWTVVALLFLALPLGSLPVIAAIGVASFFSVLWLLHMIVFARRRTRATFSYGAAHGLGTSRRDFLGIGVKAVAAGIVVSVPAACGVLGVPAIVWCDCYFDDDCGFLFYCRYDVDCSWVPKGVSDGDRVCPELPFDGSCDGLCKFLKLPYGTVGREAVARAADLYFRAYMSTAERRTPVGDPDASILAQARAIDLPENGHKELTGAVFSALDLTIGWDFGIGRRDMSDPERPGVDGIIRIIPEGGGMVRIMDATRRGFVETIRSGRPETMLPPLEEFWTNFPDYRPNHGGRCYPHGHKGYATALECQRKNLLKLATALAGNQERPQSGG